MPLGTPEFGNVDFGEPGFSSLAYGVGLFASTGDKVAEMGSVSLSIASMDIDSHSVVLQIRRRTYVSQIDHITTPVFAKTGGGIPLMVILQSGAPVLSNTTAYLGRFDSATERLIAFPLSETTLVEVTIFADSPPGDGETFTYTIRKMLAGSTSGSDTSVTGVISGASQQEVRLVGSVAYADLDKIDCKLQTSSGAAEVNHIIVPKFSFA